MAVRPSDKERFVRLRSLDDEYTEDEIWQTILGQQTPNLTSNQSDKAVRQVRFKGKFCLHKVTAKSIRALYFYYLYKLTRAQYQLERVHYLIREDLWHLDRLTAQVKFLHRHEIDTEEQLEAYKSDAEQKIARLTDECRKLHNEKRRKVWRGAYCGD